MITKVSVEKTENSRYTPAVIRDKNNAKPAFTGLGALGGWLVKGMQRCEAEPMLNVTVLDLTTAIAPRSIIETVAASKVTDDYGNPVYDENGKQKRKFNFLAGFEALRRESSGLFINCLLPGAFVMGVAKLLNTPIMGAKSNLVKNWADTSTLKTINQYYQGNGAENYSEMIKKIFLDLSGIDGKETKTFESVYNASSENKQELDRIFKNLGKLADSNKFDKESLKAAIDGIIEKTHISENIKFTKNNPENKYFGNSLESLLKNTVEVLHDAKKAGIETAEERVMQRLRTAEDPGQDAEQDQQIFPDPFSPPESSSLPAELVSVFRPPSTV